MKKKNLPFCEGGEVEKEKSPGIELLTVCVYPIDILYIECYKRPKEGRKEYLSLILLLANPLKSNTRSREDN